MGVDRKCDVLIAGAGPAGLASALYLQKRRPDLAGRVIALDKAAHPRFKVCAGGLIPKTLFALDELEIPLDVPAVDIVNGEARTEVGEVDLSRGDVLCRVIRRDQFDAMLARRARDAGVEIIEHCRVLEVAQNGDNVRVETERGLFEARILIGADGSGSRVRRAVFNSSKRTVGRALMVDVPVNAGEAREFVEQRYVFDFRCVAAGISGYCWSFPCLIDGRPHLNVGIYDQLPREDRGNLGEQALMLTELHKAFPQLPLDGLKRRTRNWHAFPIRWFQRSDRYVIGSVILAGDAAGVDPLMGEGISCAFEHGKHASLAIAEFLDGDLQALTRYDDVLLRGSIGRKLAILGFAARHFYGRRHRKFFRVASLSRRAQEIGVDWYNGAAHLDDLPPATLVARWARAVLFGGSVR